MDNPHTTPHTWSERISAIEVIDDPTLFTVRKEVRDAVYVANIYGWVHKSENRKLKNRPKKRKLKNRPNQN